MAQPPEEPFPEFGPVPGPDEDSGDVPLPWVDSGGADAPPPAPNPKIEPPRMTAPPVPEAEEASLPPKASVGSGPVGEVQIPCPSCGMPIGSRTRLCPHCRYEFKDYTPAPIRLPAQANAAPVTAPMANDEPPSAKAVRPPEFTDRPETLVARRDNPFVWAFVGLAAAAFTWAQLRSGRGAGDIIPLVAKPAAPRAVQFPPALAEPPAPPPPAVEISEPKPGPSVSPFGENYIPESRDIRSDAGAGATSGEVVVTGDLSAGESRDWLFTGRVRDILTLAPVGSAKLRFEDFKSGKQRQITTDARGRFRIRLPVPDADGYFLKVSRTSYRDRYVLEGAELAIQGPEERRERAKTAARTVQGFPLSPTEMGKLELDLLLVPDSVE